MNLGIRNCDIIGAREANSTILQNKAVDYNISAALEDKDGAEGWTCTGY